MVVMGYISVDRVSLGQLIAITILRKRMARRCRVAKYYKNGHIGGRFASNESSVCDVCMLWIIIMI